jgi:hypothetical protein
MDDGAGTVLREGRIECGGIENVAFDERAPAHELGMALRQVVECDRQEPRCGERLAGVATDKAGAASDENGFHAAPLHDLLPDDPQHFRSSFRVWRPFAESSECGGHLWRVSGLVN